ncbi:PREDICTED: autophagy-related protein 13 homolog isoform X2 [Nicrophorus vespilloides]|uniref:Autophagy-related protein 13 n=1 Tax=Nicrophorus vespilloides TaxID=110193 RepID=A0ABM1MR37_NICVS|nr:PREDICTED: autophagy-related protein 13 homolog isoform X2 [Nicrophorus vespilloides]
MAMKISAQDKKDLDKFTKFLALKSAQVIVQSRLGEKKSTQCKMHTTGTDWFNLAIEDLPDVLAETKKALNGEIVSARLPLCVEISLRTVEGDHMVLESWCLGIVPEQCDPSVRVTHTVYNRMGILLKSLVSVTRVTPAYKLSRRQGPDSYIICYRIYMEEPQLHTLGDGYKQVRVGQICTPIGTLQLSVSYRTKMTISPTNNGKDNSIMLKSDHFNTNLSPRQMRYKQNEENNASLNNTMRIGAFADAKRKLPEPEMIIPCVPFSKLLSMRKSPEQKAENDDRTEVEELMAAAVADDSSTLEVDADVAVKGKDDKNGNAKDRPYLGALPTHRFTMTPTNDDFIMKTPFATSNGNSELGKIYREWQTAPPLKTFSEIPPLSDQVPDLTKQLERYETAMKTYDDMVQALCESPNNN